MNLLVHRLLLLLILLTPVFCIGELQAMFGSTLAGQSAAVTPLYIKGIKDGLIVLLILICFFYALSKKNLFYHKVFYAFLLCAFVSLVVSLTNIEYMFVLAGVRWLAPFVLLVVIYRFINLEFLEKITKLLVFLFILGFCLQILEMFFMPPWFGVNMFGLAARNPGFFLIPSTMALFVLIVFYYVYNFYFGRLRPVILYLLCPFSIALTASGTGIITLIGLYFLILHEKMKQKELFAACAVMLFIVAILLLPILSGRADIYTSLFVRVDVFFDVISFNNIFISNTFGLGTNSAVLLSSAGKVGGEGAMIVDSLYNSLVVNSGVLSLILLLWFFFSEYKHKLIHKQLLMLVFFTMGSTIVVEVFPFNVLFVIGLINLIKRNRMGRLMQVVVCNHKVIGGHKLSSPSDND